MCGLLPPGMKTLLYLFLFATLILVFNKPYAQKVNPKAAAKNSYKVRGYATEIDGGIGQPIYRVTNLNNDGPGSLREGLKTGNRLIVFEVGGAIKLTSDIGMPPNKHNITIAGETAPSPGITLQGKSLQIRGSNVVISHIAVERGHDSTNTGNADGIQFIATGRSIRNVHIDHCLTAWGTDEGLQLFISPKTKDGPVNNISITNCIFTEPLDWPKNLGFAPNDKKVRHGYNALLSDYITEVDFQRNLCANGTMRNPRMGFGTKIICANNIALNWGTTAISWEKNCEEPMTTTVIGNLGISGPNTTSPYFISFWQKAPVGSQIYAAHNTVWKGTGSKVTPSAEVFHKQGAPDSFTLLTQRPLDLPGLAPLPADKLYEQMLKNVGPRPKNRKNPVALRAVKQLKDKTGKIIDHQSQVNGYSELLETKRPLTRKLAPPADYSDKKLVKAWLQHFKNAVQYD